jgi:hypothetical protein
MESRVDRGVQELWKAVENSAEQLASRKMNQA